MDYVMALDVGGTGMKAALLDRDGAELYRAHRRTGRERGPAAVVDAVLDFARELAALGGRDLGRPAIARAWTEHTGRPTSAARDVGEAMAAGDATAAAPWQEAVDAFADGLTTALGLLDPDTVVIGGGLAQAGERLLAPLRTALGERAAFRSLPRVLAAELGERAGCIGAGLLARGLLDDARNAGSAAGRSTRPRTAARTETDQ